MSTGVGNSLIKMKKLLITCYGGGHVKIVAPLYSALKSQYDITILALTTAGHYFEKQNIPFIRMSDFEELLNDKVLKYGEKLIDKSSSNAIVPLKESIAYHGLSFSDLVDDLNSEVLAQKKFDKYGRACFLPVTTLSYIIRELRPDLVIATNSPRAERAALIASKDMSIPNICINDNIWIEGGARQVAELNCIDLLCVLSKEVKASLLKATSFPEEKIVITGTPVFDNLKLLKNEIVLIDKIKNTKKVILLADCDLPKYNSLYPGVSGDETLGNRIRSELDRLAKKNDWKVIFRPHPSQSYNYGKYKNISISKSEELHKLLLTVDVVITAISTVGLEGKALGKGLVSIEGSIYRAAGSYAKLGLSVGITDESQLEEAIKKEMNNSKNHKEELFKGSAIENISKCIIQLLKSSD